MLSVLDEICKLRENQKISVNRHNSNRHCLILNEDDGSKTAYCFSVPIYRDDNRRLVPLRFSAENNEWSMRGSSVQVMFEKDIIFADNTETCTLQLPDLVYLRNERSILGERTRITPTLNGLAFFVKCAYREKYEMLLSLKNKQLPIRANSKYVALMMNDFRPYITVSCIASVDKHGKVIAPCEISYQKQSDLAVSLTVTPSDPQSEYVMFEVNVHEAKLFHDTTVESGHPLENNAFGSTAFIGHTASCGEQWLYTKLDLKELSEIKDTNINRVLFHLPKHTTDTVDLTALRVKGRFCSFGSNWDNKIDSIDEFYDSVSRKGYHTFNITKLMRDAYAHNLILSEGLILKTKVKDGGFSAIATGDSFYRPQLLEINFI